MKKLFIYLFSVLAILALSVNGMAQEKSTAKIATVKQKGKTVSFTITASQPFRMGGNRYFLHIGDKEFSRSTQSVNKGHGSITFLIPADEYKRLPGGKSIFLTYGHSYEDNDDLLELSNHNDPNCMALGKFSKKLLTR